MLIKHFVIAGITFLSTVAGGQELRPQDLYKKALPSVMTLSVAKEDGSRGTGSAFLAIKDGLAITAWHVVNGAKTVTAKFSDGEQFEVSGIVDKDERRDVAIVRVKVFGRPLLTLLTGDPDVGSRAYVIGAPRGLEFSVSDGLLSQVQVFEGLKQYQFTCPASPGNSGGPLINSRGESIGVVSWQVREGQNLNFAVPIGYVKGLDISLPTQPWGRISPSSIATLGTTPNDELDQLFAESINAIFDMHTAEYLTARDAVQKSGGFKSGVPPYLYTRQQVLLEIAKRVEAASSDEPNRSPLLAAVKNDSKYLLESTSLLIEALQLAQSTGGWTPGANDKYSRSLACNQLAQQVTRERISKLSGSVKLYEALTPDQRRSFGLTTDPLDFSLGVRIWTSNSLQFLDVPDDSFAYTLGFRNWDRIRSVNGTVPEDLQTVKKIMRKFAGKELKVVVNRYSDYYEKWEDEELEIDVPKKLPDK